MLSNLMRYMIYESSKERVQLTQELQYINDYIELESIRLNESFKMEFTINGDGNPKIAPLVLFPFFENAFKHGISYSHASTIHIHIKVFEKILTLYVENPVVENNSFAGGLGLRNVKRRLELLYPGHHTLGIEQKDHLNIVNLKIDLS